MGRFRWVHHQRISNSVAIWCVALSLFHVMYAGGLHYDPQAFVQSRIFEVVFDLAPLSWWKFGFLVPGGILIFGAISRWFTAWVIGMFFSTVVAVSWLVCIVIARLDGAPLTLGGIGLWLWFLFTNIAVMVQPHQIDVLPPGLCAQESDE